jgi:cupin fold WbuC family metalloprotein
MKTIDQELYRDLCLQADRSPRRRAHHLLHADHDDPVQRLGILMLKGSYVRPHRHQGPPKWEMFSVLRGAGVALMFDEDGRVLERVELGEGRDSYVIEFPPGSWHSLTALEDHSLFLETKPGPFRPVDEKDFAAWAPPEGSPRAAAFSQWFLRCRVGERPPA